MTRCSLLCFLTLIALVLLGFGLSLPGRANTPGLIVEGRVTYGPTGKPAAGIKVHGSAMYAAEGYGEAVTGLDGHYRIEGLKPGRYVVELLLDPDVQQNWTAQAHSDVGLVAGGKATVLDFTLIKGAVIKGHVLAAGTGAPVAGLQIGLYGPANPEVSGAVGTTTTAADGSFLLRTPGGLQYLYLMSQPPRGLLPPTAPPTSSVPVKTSTRLGGGGYDLTVKDGQTATVKFLLPASPAVQKVSGRVVGPDGKPVPGAEVSYSQPSESAGNRMVQADADGKFQIDPPSALPLSMRAKSGDAATPKPSVLIGGGPVTLHLEPHALVGLSGRVEDSDGKPLAGVKVVLITWDSEMGMGGLTTTTGEDGRYAFPGLWPDAGYSLSVSKPGYGDDQSPRATLTPGEMRGLPLFHLLLANSFLAGRVVNVNGDPLPAVPITAYGRHTDTRMTISDAEGQFRLEGLVAGDTLHLQAHLENRDVDKKVQTGAENVILVLPEAPPAAGASLAIPTENFGALLGHPAPPLRAERWVNLSQTSLPRWNRKVALIDFWGIGCGPCVAVLPGVQRAWEYLRPQGVVVVGLHDSGVSPPTLQEFARQHHLTYPQAIDAPAKGWFGKTFQNYTVVGIPAVAVIDRAGNVAYLGNSLGRAVEMAATLAAQPVSLRDKDSAGK